MQLIASHMILVSASSIGEGSAQVEDFFRNSLLVRYDKIDIRAEKCYGGSDKEFNVALYDSIAANRKTVCSFIEEFKKTGFQTADDLAQVKCGYPSKMLHIIAHFLDGFIGIDSVFYNLIEDNHWVSEETARAIKAAPQKFWLISLDCYSETPEKAGVLQQ